ncbi:Protein of unknown function [Andreprevotia lacus DSM 23236]|jgi:hypothetical protein|uniref:DUF2917 domain-containing protein n=1 Tax=Andreprevotia lacus DSM 23236 TaxID=1121001 RepID=A0A1W1X2M1_9NEIS|nr:DUF2917 domain-containing protein [Andreprevotia lacus]SMC18147.1 Protein of unknown function [Andreprevotia lacus DSM 23236]
MLNDQQHLNIPEQLQALPCGRVVVLPANAQVNVHAGLLWITDDGDQDIVLAAGNSHRGQGRMLAEALEPALFDVDRPDATPVAG